jgi:hypothetical protein
MDRDSGGTTAESKAPEPAGEVFIKKVTDPRRQALTPYIIRKKISCLGGDGNKKTAASARRTLFACFFHDGFKRFAKRFAVRFRIF